MLCQMRFATPEARRLSIRRLKTTYSSNSSGRVRSFATRSIRVLKPPSSQLAALLTKCLTQSPRPLTLSQLLSYGRPLSATSLLSSATYVLSEIPRRLARRIRALESLPFIVGTNPYVARTLETHRESFEWLATHAPARTLEENTEFTARLELLVHRHANDIPTLAKGFYECSRYMSQDAVTDFLDHTIRNVCQQPRDLRMSRSLTIVKRIAVRLIAEQHIALSRALEENQATVHHNGVVDMECSPSDMINTCSSIVNEMCEATFGIAPRVKIDGFAEATFPYVPIHLQYMITELLKNAFRATVEKHRRIHGAASTPDLPPITMTISPFPQMSVPDRPSYMSIRIRDEGGGITPSNMTRIFSYAFTTAGSDSPTSDETDGGPYAAQHVGGSAAIGGDGMGGAGDANLFGEMTSKGVQTGVGTLAGLGYGLPMSRLYARSAKFDMQMRKETLTDCVRPLGTDILEVPLIFSLLTAGALMRS